MYRDRESTIRSLKYKKFFCKAWKSARNKWKIVYNLCSIRVWAEQCVNQLNSCMKSIVCFHWWHKQYFYNNTTLVLNINELKQSSNRYYFFIFFLPCIVYVCWKWFSTTWLLCSNKNLSRQKYQVKSVKRPKRKISSKIR